MVLCISCDSKPKMKESEDSPKYIQGTTNCIAIYKIYIFVSLNLLFKTFLYNIKHFY